MRNDGPTFAPELALAAIEGRVRGGVNLGYRVRKRVDAVGLVIDDEIFARGAAGVTVAPATEVALSASIAAPSHDLHRNQVAAELLAGGSRRVTDAIGVFVAAGLGLDNGFGTPDWRALAGLRVDSATHEHVRAPEPDTDGDGIIDARDRCPTQPEDKDGFQDDDGCPDPDNDGDGIADADDRCPNQAEDKDGFEDSDGCPDPSSTLTGVVIGPEGQTVGNVALSVVHVAHPEIAAIEVTAGDDGSFSLPVNGGSMKITATAPDYQTASTETTVAPGASASVRITLARKVRQGQLRGQVQSFDGKPLAATIKVTGKITSSATTDADGLFTIELPEGSFEVVIEAPGYATQKRTVNVKLDGVTVLNADMRGTK